MKPIKLTLTKMDMDHVREYTADVAPEEVQTMIMVLKGSQVDVTPESLTERTTKGQCFFNKPVSNISASHLPHHTNVGDKFTIKDLKTNEMYTVKFTEAFFDFTAVLSCVKNQSAFAVQQVALLKEALNDTAVDAKADAPAAAPKAGK